MKLKKSVKDIQQSGTSELSSSQTSMIIGKGKDKDKPCNKDKDKELFDTSEFKFKFIITNQHDNRWVQILELLLSLSLTSTGQVFGFSVAAFSAFSHSSNFPPAYLWFKETDV